MNEEVICLEAFNKLCQELTITKLVSLDESQFWLFEHGYKAAVEELINNISIAAKSQHPVMLEQKYLAQEMAIH